MYRSLVYLFLYCFKVWYRSWKQSQTSFKNTFKYIYIYVYIYIKFWIKWPTFDSAGNEHMLCSISTTWILLKNELFGAVSLFTQVSFQDVELEKKKKKSAEEFKFLCKSICIIDWSYFLSIWIFILFFIHPSYLKDEKNLWWNRGLENNKTFSARIII